MAVRWVQDHNEEVVVARRKRLETGVDWVELRTTDADWAKADPGLLGTMLTQMHLIRAFEEAVLDLAAEGLVHGPAHSSIGQEGGAVGSIAQLRDGDSVSGSHRGHHQFLAKAFTYVTKGELDPKTDFPSKVSDVLRWTLAEILGLTGGFSGGRGGSMHLQWLEAGALGTNAIVGGGAPMAAGTAYAQKFAGTSDVSVNYFGDGSAQIGSVLESFNLAAVWKLPVCFFIENNLYAVSTRVEDASADTRLSVRGQGFGIPSWRVDGMDPLAVHLAMQEALTHMRSGKGPVIIEAETYRYRHQNGPYPGSVFGYRTKEEEEEWLARDPLELVGTKMIERGLLAEEDVVSLRERALAVMKSVTAYMIQDESGKRRIKEDLWPDPATVDDGIRSDESELQELPLHLPNLPKREKEVRFVEAIAEVTKRRMDQDSRIIVMGEDVHQLGGGTNGATRGLIEAFGPERVIGTPISENGFFGIAGGMALDGRIRPIVEFMYPDFMWVAADQVFNQVGKIRHMFGGHNNVPLVLRTKVAMGSGYGSQHLMDPAGIFATSAGWRIVAPSTAEDYIGLMNAALALDDPVLVIEHVDLYGKREQIPAGDLDYIIPPRSAKVVREGQEATVLTYLSMVAASQEAIARTDLDAELIDLRWLDRASIDWETIEVSIKKTNVVVIVEQGNRGTSYGGWLADEIQRRYFDWLDQPVLRVTGGEASPTISKVLEQAAIAGVEDIVAELEAAKIGLGAQ